MIKENEVLSRLEEGKGVAVNHQKSLFFKQAEDPGRQSGGMRADFMGFTLIELLVVVLIIGILAAVALPQYQKAVMKSRLTQMLVRVKALHDGAEVYYLANGFYPSDIREVDLDVTQGAEINNSVHFTSSIVPAAFYPDGMECIIIGGHYAACGNVEDGLYLQKTFVHEVNSEYGPGRTSCCGKQDTLMDQVCRSAARKSTRDWFNNNVNFNCYFLE